MIISNKYKFVFIKTLKTAGTSIEVFLSRHCGPNDIVTPIFPVESSHEPRNSDGFYGHISAAEVDRLVPGVLREYHSFCVERHPYEKVVSDYCMLRNSPDHKLKENLTWDEYFAHGRFPVNNQLYMNADRQSVIVQSVLQYESLNAGLNTLCKRLNIPFPGQLDVRAKGEYRSNYLVTNLEKHNREKVDRIFAREFDLWGYNRW